MSEAELTTSRVISESDSKLLGSLNQIQALQVSKLSDEQYKALIEILEWTKKTFGYEMGHILAGFSGSGKTYLIRLISSLLPKSILCAPTNKAVKELKKLRTDRDCCTIYSLLGLKMEQHEDTIRLVKNDSNKAFLYKYVILDECGMVNSELFSYIKNAMLAGVKFLFVGDPKQLPPVGEKLSRVWRAYPTSKLIQVQRHDNQILEVATHIRKAKTLKDIEIESNNDNAEGVWYLNPSSFEERMIEYASAGEFEKDTKAIAWRNRTVDRLNDIVRRVIYGDKVFESKYLENDRVVFTSPYSIGKNIAVFTDDEAIVKDVVVSNHTDYDLLCYYLTLDLDGREIIVKTIHETNEKKFDRLLNEIANSARQPGGGSNWKKFWELRESLCYLKYAHALTAHRSQGSTYTNVFVDSSDICVNQNKVEAKKCLYVACTRPSKRLFVM